MSRNPGTLLTKDTNRVKTFSSSNQNDFLKKRTTNNEVRERN
jgi:hypothetical protein